MADDNIYARLSNFEKYVIQDEQALAKLDRRFVYREYESEHSTVPYLEIAQTDSLGPGLQSILGLESAAGKAVLLGGGLAQYWSVLSAQRCEEEMRGELYRDVAALFRQYNDRGVHAVAPFVPLTDAQGVARHVSDVVVEGAIESFFVLDVSAASDPGSFVAGLPRRVRRNWTRDRRNAVGLRLSYSVADLSVEAAVDAAPAIAATTSRHENVEPVLIAEWRLRSYLRRPGRHVLVRISCGDVVVAVGGWTLLGGILNVHSFGCHDGVEAKRDIYHYVFSAALEYALQQSVDYIMFGMRHAGPKLARGCLELPQWRLRSALQS